MIKNVQKRCFTFLLVLVGSISVALAQYATGGTSPYRDQVLWITWGDGENGTHNQPLANGSTSGASIIVADGQVLNFTFTIENASGNSLLAYRPGNWDGDILDDLYNIGGVGGSNQLISGISATAGIASFTIRATATLNGVPFPIKGFVMADAEAINTTNEHIEGTAAGEWYVVEMAKNIGAGQYRAVKTDNGDGTQTLRLGPGTDNGTAAVSFLAITNPAAEVTADFSIRGGGTTAIAIGVLTPNADFGDAPESYGGAMHLIPDLVFSPDNIPADGTALNLNTNDYTPGGLNAPTAGYLGSRGPDAEGGSTFSADGLGDDQSGLFVNEGDEEDAWPGANIYVEHAGSTLIRQIPCTGIGTVAGWIDFNRNGTFDAGERAAAGCGVTMPGYAELNWVIPNDIQRGLSFVRLRFASNANEILSASSVAEDGEVEDHAITIWQQEIVLVKEGEFNGADQERAGGEVLYTFTLTNMGNVPLENIVVEDEKLDDQNVVIQWTVDGVSWNPSTDQLDGGKTAIGTAIYVLSQEEVDAGFVENQAYVSATPVVDGEWPATPIEDQPSDDPGPNGPDDPTVLPIPSNPSLSIAKSTSFTGFASVGQLVEYFFTVTNTGNVTIENIEVNDPLLGGAIANANTDASAPWPVATGTLAPGESVMLKAQYVVNEADVMGGTVVNTATVSGDDPSDPGERLEPASSNSVTINMFDPCAISPTNPDSDGDGIADACDLDDDNDGILDIDECPYVPNPVMVVNTNQGELLEYNTATNTFVTLCSGIIIEGGIVGDIAMDANGDIWGITNTNRLIKIDPSNCTVTDIITDLGFSGNGLSFLPDGNLLAGGGGDALVRKIDVVGGTYATSVWADFSSGNSNGDFIYIDGKVYVLWFDATANPTYPLLIEVIVDESYDYVSHTVLGTLPRYTWGLAKVNGNELYGVTGIGVDGYPNPAGTVVRIHIDPSFSWTTATSFPQQFFGATSSDEAVLECDTDGDGIPDRLDPDSDNDGCPDAVEYYGSLDALGTDGGFYGEGNPPAVDAQGRVVGASYTGNHANVVIATQLGVETSPDDVIANVGTEAVFVVDAKALQTTQFENGNPDFTVPPASDVSAGLIYQWQVSTDGGNAWTNLTDSEQYEGANTASLTITDVTIDLHTYQYRVEVTHATHICPVFSDAAVLTVPSADIAVEKTISNATPDIGTDVTFTVTVTNNGLDDATGVEVLDMLPSGYTYVSHSGVGTYDEVTGVWAVGDLDADAEAALIVVATVNEVGEYTNTAVVSAEEYDPTPDNNESSVTPNPVSNPSLSFVKTGVLSTDGNTITYTFTVENTGNVTMGGITVADPKLPAGVTVTPTTLAPGEVATGTASYTVTQGEKDAGEVENQATVTGIPPFDPADPAQPGEPITPVPSTPDENNPGTPGDPGIPTVVDIPANPSLSFVKTGLLSTDGNTITYTFTVENTGNVTMGGITVADPKLPAGVTVTPTTLAPGEVATGTASYTVTQGEKDAGEVENQATVTGIPPFDPADPAQPGEPITPVPSTPDENNPGTPGDPGIPTVVDIPANPSLSFVKTGLLSTDGNTIEYTFTVTNTGNVTMNDITVDDPKITGAITLDATELAPGEVATGTASYTVTQGEKDAGEVENQATVTGIPPFDPTDPAQPGEPITPVPSTPDEDNPGTPGDPGIPTVIDIPAVPSLSLTKSATSEGPYAAGDYINFEIIVRNMGNVTLKDVTVTDDNAEIVSGSPVASLAPGEEAAIVARHRVTQEDVDFGRVVNQAKVTGDDPEGNKVPDVPSDNPDTPDQPNDPTVVELTQRPGLSLTKRATGEGPYALGDYINFDIAVRNTGNVTLENVTVTDDNAEVVSGSPVAILAPGATATVVARHRVTQADVDAGRVVNQAKATGEDPEGKKVPDVPSDNPDTPDQPNDPTVVELTQRPGLSLTKRATGEGPYALGDYINFDIAVRNTGNVTLTEVTVTDDNAEVVSGSPVAILAPGATATVVARHRVTQADVDAGRVVNQAKVTGEDPEGNKVPDVPSDNPDTPDQPNDPTVVELTQRPGLSLTKRATGEGPYALGDYINFDIAVRNTGNVTLENVTVTDDNAEVVSGSPVAILAPGATATVVARHRVTQADVDAGRVVNQAKVTGEDPEGNKVPDVPSDNPDTPDQPNDPTVVELTQQPSLSLTKRATGEGPYALDDYIDFEIVVRNTGNVTLENVTVTDANAEVVSGSPIARLLPNAGATVLARHRVTQADIDAGHVVNQAKVTGDDPEGNPIGEVPSDNPDTPQPNDPTVVELTQQPRLSLAKRATGEGPYALGDYIDFEIVVRNTGNVTLENVTVTDANAEVVSGSPIARLLPNAGATVLARHRVTQADIDAGHVVNQAKVTGDDPEGNPIGEVPSDNPDTPQPNDPTVVELTQQPRLSLAKRATGEGPYALGDYIDFEIVVRNTGNVTLENVTVTDANAEVVSGSPIARLLPNAGATVLARHRVTQADIDAGHVVNQAKVTGDDPEGNPIGEVPSDNPDTPQPNDPTVVELGSKPALSLSKGITSEGPYNVGDHIKYFNIVVTNTGNVTLTDVVVTDDNAEILSGSPIARLRPGASAVVMARHLVTQADVEAGQVVNQAKVIGKDPAGKLTQEVPSDDPDTPEEGDETITPVAQTAKIRIDKTADRERVDNIGERITYQLVVVNTGNITLKNITVIDPLTGFEQRIAFIRPGVANAHTFQTRYTVTAADLQAGKVVNTATVTADDPDGNPVSHRGSAEVQTYRKVIEAEDDDFGPVNGRGGGLVGNIFSNDKINGFPVDPADVVLTRLPAEGPSPLTLEEDGSVTVAPNTPAGSYTFDYQVCDVTDRTNCDVATVTVLVAASLIEAEDDVVAGVNGYAGKQGVINVFSNDKLDGQPIVPDDVTLTVTRTDPALRLNPDGSVDVVSGTRGGTYTLEYQICEKLNPGNCATATVTVTVVNPLKIPNAFTPNGDGHNDRFEIIGIEGFDRIAVIVINRWGNEVYRNEDYHNDWDGGGLNEGTYYYVIETHRGNVRERHTGWLLIKRQ